MIDFLSVVVWSMDLDFRELFPQKVQNANLRLHIDPPPDIPPWRYEMVKALVGFDSNGMLKMTPLPEHLDTQQNWEERALLSKWVRGAWWMECEGRRSLRRSAQNLGARRGAV